MISYKDRTFCPFYESCDSGHVCVRALTPDIEKGAKAAGMPISQFFDKPWCYESKTDINAEREIQGAAEEK